MIFGALSGILWFAFFLLAHIVYFFVHPYSTRAKVLFRFLALILSCELISVVVASVGLPYSGLLMDGGIFMAVLWGWLMILCLFVLYMPFYLAVARSLTVETMILINNRQEGQYSIEQLQEIFVSKSLVSGRLETMVLNGWLSRCGDGYVLTGKGRFIAKCFRFMKKLWNLGTGG
jgi:hypothetical protein